MKLQYSFWRHDALSHASYGDASSVQDGSINFILIVTTNPFPLEFSKKVLEFHLDRLLIFIISRTSFYLISIEVK